MLLFEGTLTLDGQAIPARLELAIDRRELAALLEAGGIGQPRREWRAVPVDPARSGDAACVSPAGKTPDPRAEGSPRPVMTAGATRTTKGFEPIEIREHPGRRIRFEHLAMISDPAKIWAALAERFPWAGFKVPSGTPELTAGDLAGEMDHPAESGEVISQLDSDWLVIEPHLGELVNDEGRPVRGYQTKIAALLSGTNDGHFRRARVEPVVNRLKRWIEEEWVFSTSSSPDDEADEGDETTPGAVRVA